MDDGQNPEQPPPRAPTSPDEHFPGGESEEAPAFWPLGGAGAPCPPKWLSGGATVPQREDQRTVREAEEPPAQALTSHAFILLVPCRSCSIFSSTPLRPQMSNTVRPCWYPTSCTNPVTP